MNEGSCLCGQVRFHLHGKLHSVRYCHCSNCRKFAGTSPAAWAMANLGDLTTTPDAQIGKFDSGHGIRCFCPHCGSPLWFESKDYPSVVGIPLGVIDAGTIPLPEMHLWVQSKPDWCSINDDIPKYMEGPGSAQTDA